MNEATTPTRKYTRRRETWGSKRKLPSGRYQASYLGPDGERYTGPQTFDTIGDARAWLNGIKRTIDSGKWKNPKVVHAELFGDYARTWISAQVNATGEPLRPRTRAEYERYLEKGLEPLCGERIDAITAVSVRSWHATRSTKGKTAAAREARLLRAVLNTAVEDELIARNPVDSRLCRTAAGLKHRPPSEAELGGVLEVFADEAPELRLAVLLAAYGGLRLSEWRALRRSDLSVIDGRFEVNVKRQVQRTPLRLRAEGVPAWTVGPPKSAEGVRTVTLPAWLTDEVTKHLATYVQRFDSALLFAPTGGAEYLDDQRFNKPWNKARDVLRLRVKVSGKGQPVKHESTVREHDLRAFAATYYVRGGATMREVQALLGHGSTEAAFAYQHAVGDRAAELADRMPAPAGSPTRPASFEEQRAKRRAVSPKRIGS